MPLQADGKDNVEEAHAAPREERNPGVAVDDGRIGEPPLPTEEEGAGSSGDRSPLVSRAARGDITSSGSATSSGSSPDESGTSAQVRRPYRPFGPGWDNTPPASEEDDDTADRAVVYPTPMGTTDGAGGGDS